MSTYSSYAGDFFGHQNQSLGHLAPQQQLFQHDPMIFHPAPTYYAPSAQVSKMVTLKIASVFRT